MVMPATARRYTVEEVLGFPADGNRYEVVHGELLVTPAPAAVHQILVSGLFYRIQTYLDRHAAIARALVSPADITWGRDVLVQPDVFVVAAAEMSRDWKTYKTLLLAVEVLSPSSARGDRVTKRRAYQEHGVGTYWIVDPEARVVEVWHPDDERPEVVADLLRWRVTPEAEELVIDLAELFATLPD